jgi:hypothetical protein
MAIVKINWPLFEGNSSSTEALYDFAKGDLPNFSALEKELWCKETRAEVGKLRKLGLKKARTLARLWANRSGFGNQGMWR